MLRDEVIRRLEREPQVHAVTYAADIPGTEASVRIEVDSTPARVRLADVDAAFFDVFDVPPLVGRTFTAADAGPHANVAVVNRTFVDSLLGGGHPIGRQLRTLGTDAQGRAVRGPWQTIVGVVRDFPAQVDYERPPAVWYSPTRHVQPARLAIHVRGTDPAGFAPRLRAITTDVDASLFLRAVQPLSDALWATHLPLRLVAAVLIAIALSVLILSSASLYALMSVIVTQRRREIGIRLALGADGRRVLSSIFRRAAVQVGGGVALGVVIAGVVLHFTAGEMRGFNALVVLPGVSLFMAAVGVLAALGPARRGLAIQPSAVLKEE
jgi:hypothetical protein